MSKSKVYYESERTYKVRLYNHDGSKPENESPSKSATTVVTMPLPLARALTHNGQDELRFRWVVTSRCLELHPADGQPLSLELPAWATNGNGDGNGAAA